MQVSPSAALRGTRLWNKPGDLRSPCLSQNATRTERLPRSVSHFPQISFLFLHLLFWTNSLNVIYSYKHLLFLLPQVQCHTLTGYCWCVTSDGKPVSGSSVHNRTPVCSGTVSGKRAGNLRVFCPIFWRKLRSSPHVQGCLKKNTRLTSGLINQGTVFWNNLTHRRYQAHAQPRGGDITSKRFEDMAHYQKWHWAIRTVLEDW